MERLYEIEFNTLITFLYNRSKTIHCNIQYIVTDNFTLVFGTEDVWMSSRT